MSRVYFHSPSGDAELLGSERYHLSGLAKATAMGQVIQDPDRFRALLPPGHYLSQLRSNHPGAWAGWYETALKTGDAVIEYEGQPIESFALLLNTALETGDEALRLAARIDGQCEIHGWVDGPNRKWLAGMMRAAVDAGMFRRGFLAGPGPGGERVWSEQGWGEVIALLLARDDEPVVMSYSVCKGFPNPTAAGVVSIEDDPDEEFEGAREAFDLLPRSEQWATCMAELRTGVNGLEFKPDNWEEFRFVHRLSMLDLMADDWEERLRETAAWLREAAAADAP
jgi:hypothetical protein